jgi:hypothetical protein
VVAIVASILVVVGAACSGGGGDSDDSAASDGGGGGSETAATADADSQAGAPVDLASVRVEAPQHVISTAELAIEVTDPEDAAGRATAIARDAGGFLFSQEASLTDDVRVVAVYKVPPDRFDGVVDALAQLGDVQTRMIDTEDVTGQVVDLDARVTNARTSVERLRDMLSSSGGVADLLAVEQALAAREAEMESLAAQLAALRGRVDLATVTVTLREAGPQAADAGGGIPGFASGLRTGAAAFGNSVLVVVTALGFVAPFLPVFAVAAALWWWLARRRTARTV